ncbi:HTH-type transcriptional activator AllS [Budviciaceae bacterium BWR-B9]|uniref:HTH-type transcriptional activator AllS n=1 Tax=Limnobaculum allomyrinae TaxID=2791986 RepID=A0ABS1ILQ9_9GAMM|nr:MULTISPECIES: HTH-type transcriptional activator AllS [Limnobaculum]MBK5142687.1 HTH-type transcriptional activator AllS [Limnobaculum allomyrinae]MBV7690427.1 HTH-type transcriptional activator AllS [Limnobaculum sp. M2-1]
MLDQETLRTFIKVAESKSFSKAAENLHKTPAAISYRIKMLEESLGTQLFLRTTRTVSLTPAGNHLLERCHQWLSWIDGMPDELNQINDGVERQVNLVVNNLLYNASAAAKLLSWLHQRFPFTQFRLSRQVYMGVWDAMLHDDFQLAIGVTGSESLSNTIRLLPFGDVSWVFVLSPNHPLATKSGVLTDNMLRAYPAINIEDTSLKLTKRVAWLLSGQKEIKVPDLHTKLECHLLGVGVGFLPKNLCQRFIDNGQLITKEVENKRQPSPLSLAWSHHERMGKAVREIVSLFKHNDEKISGFLTNIDRRPNLE